MADEDQKEEVVIHIDTKTEKRQLRMDLSDEELLKYGSEMAEAQQEVNELTDEMKSVQKDFKNKIDDVEKRVEKNGRLLRERYELREGEVQITLDYDAGTIVVIRTDTGKEIERRNMNDAEKQRKLKIWPEEGSTPSDDPNYEPALGHVEIHDAIKIIHEKKRASVTALQRCMGINANRASMIMWRLEELGVIGVPAAEGEPREILKDEVTLARFLEEYPEKADEKAAEDALKVLTDSAKEETVEEELPATQD